MAGDGGSAAGTALGVFGLGLNYMGARQQQSAAKKAQQRLEQAQGRYNTRQTAYNDQLTGQLDALGQERRNQLTALLQGQASPNRNLAGTNASALAGTQMNTALSQNRAGLPWQGNSWANQGSGAVSGVQGQQQAITNNQIGNALGYAQASRGAQGLETYDRQALNNYGTGLVGIDRRTGESQADTALRQAKLDEIWGRLGLKYGAGVNHAQNVGQNTQMLGNALMLGGTYVNATQANQPSQSYQTMANNAQYDPYFSAYQGPH